MRRLFIVALIAMIGILPAVYAGNAFAQSQQAAQSATADTQKDRLLAAGAGAILGILFFNMVTTHFGHLPFVSAGIAPLPKDLAVGSRIIAALSAGSGAIGAHFLYHWTH